MSSSLVNRPNPMRIVARARLSEWPRAERTWLGTALPEVQADPELTAKPLNPSAKTSAVKL